MLKPSVKGAGRSLSLQVLKTEKRTCKRQAAVELEPPAYESALQKRKKGVEYLKGSPGKKREGLRWEVLHEGKGRVSFNMEGRAGGQRKEPNVT